MARKVWYLYKDGVNFGQRVSKYDAIRALEQEAGRAISTINLGDKVGKEQVMLEKLFPLDNLLVAKLEEVK